MREMLPKIRLIGAASGLGAQDKACADGPVVFHQSQVWNALEHHPRLDWGRILYAPDAGAPIARIAALCRDLADEVAHALRAGEMPLVIGGDHSVAIGTWSGVARVLNATPGLLWIDAHLDSHTPASSYSGAIHGMPLACLLGQGDRRLLGIGLPGAQVAAAHTAVLGSRSYEAEEKAFLMRQGVRIFDSGEIAARGFRPCLDDALAIVAAAPAGFGVTLDLDAIDPVWAPGVGSPEPEGLSATEAVAAMVRLAGHAGLRALEIVEYNPDRDEHGRTARIIAALIDAYVEAGTRVWS